jgi:putative oxidoreductase
MQNLCNAWAPLLGRLFLAAIFVFSGINKVLNFEGVTGAVESVGIPLPAVATVITIILELGGALLLIVGWKIRLGALALIVFTALATAFFHMDFADQSQVTQFLKNLGLIGGLLYVIAYGAGRYALDSKADETGPAPNEYPSK